MAIRFTKMSGSGNDFIIIDNRVPVIRNEEKRDLVRKICQRRTSIGADGVIFVENSDTADFKWDFYNDDGSSAEMCGNGGRCVARYAFENKIAPQDLSFETLAGIITAEVRGVNVKIKLTPPHDYRADVEVNMDGDTLTVDSINTGVPHAILYSDNIEGIDIVRLGRGIRHHETFAPRGTNVDFVQKKDDHTLRIRTYERGVEGETLACGTGVVASVLTSVRRNHVQAPVSVETKGGDILKVHFEMKNGSFGDVYLEGPARKSFEGTLIEI